MKENDLKKEINIIFQTRNAKNEWKQYFLANYIVDKQKKIHEIYLLTN